MIEKQPQIFSLAHAVLNAATSGPSSRHMISGLVSIERPCSEYSGKTTRSIVGMPFRALVTKAQILFACAARSAFVTTTGSCDCTSPITTPSGDLFSPPSPLIALLPLTLRSFGHAQFARDRKSTRLNSSHLVISYAVFCLKKNTYSTISSE